LFARVPTKMEEKTLKNLKVAIVAEELTQLGGAERVLDAIMEIFPKSPIYTLVWDKEKTQHVYDKFDVRTSFIQKMPFGIKKYKWYLPFFPKAIEAFDFSEFDLIISSSSALIKGIKTEKRQTHICYCHTPTRYLWSDVKDYLKTAPIPAIVRPIMPLVVKALRKWDLVASRRPDFYIANSHNIQNKIKKYYGRESIVIYPPVETDKFKIATELGDYYLITGRVEPYKKVDLVVEAFNRSGRKLKVIGSGTRKEELARTAKPNVEFMGRVSDEELSAAYSKCLAFIFPPEEDFGIVPVEAMAAGRPVVAFKKGGALETVVAGVTGEFFFPQTPLALNQTLKKFKPKKYDSQKIREHAKKFDKEVFKTQLIEYIESKLK